MFVGGFRENVDFADLEEEHRPGFAADLLEEEDVGGTDAVSVFGLPNEYQIVLQPQQILRPDMIKQRPLLLQPPNQIPILSMHPLHPLIALNYLPT